MVVLKTDRTIGPLHTSTFKLRPWKLLLGVGAESASEHPLPVVHPSPNATPSPEDQNGCLLSMAVYLLLPRACVFHLGLGPYIQGKSSGRIRRHPLLVRSAQYLGDGSSEHL